jgi:hypothetical protein
VDFSEHLIISAAGSAAILAGGGDANSAAAFGLAAVFIDLDHFPDYWRETGFNLDIPRFMSYFSTRQVKRLVILLHAWEWCLATLLGLLISGCQAAWPYWACLGWFVHLLLDQRFNRLHHFTYFFFFRLRHAFWSRPLHPH